MKKRKYTVSEKVKQQHRKQADWDKRIRLLTLVNQGWSVHAAAKLMRMSHQGAYELYNKIKHMSVEEAEKIAASLD